MAQMTAQQPEENKVFRLPHPRGLTRFAARLPIWLYQHNLGRLLGNRFLLLTHRGRKSGLPRHVVLEVVGYHADTGVYVVAAAWGEKADWYLNILKTPVVRVRVGRKRFKAIAERLSQDDALRELQAYAGEHPFAFRELAGLLFDIDTRSRPTAETFRAFVRSIPLVALRPVSG
jgi:deazaflavin-dependent oxidoreductase (nitroreductase family)